MKKILFLDGSDPWYPPLPRLMQEGKIGIIVEGELGNRDEYIAPPTFLQRLEEWTAKNEFDLILLGNNRGIGLIKGAMINRSVRPKTIVISNVDLELGMRTMYEKLGYSRFMSRAQLIKELPKEFDL